MISQDIVQTQAYVIELMVEVEHADKKRRAALGEKGSAVAAAETKAQGEEYYGLYRISQLAYELAGEQVWMIQCLLGLSDYE